MAVVSDAVIASAARAAGFPTADLATAVAVALAESGGNATATNKNTNGTTDYGLWQINSIHTADLAAGNWQDPASNARMAFAVYTRAGRKWTPWYAWRDGKHLPFLPRGAAAAGTTPDGADPVDEPLVDVGLIDGYQSLANSTERIVKTLSDRDLWIRVGFYALAGVFLLVGLVGLIWALGGKSVVNKVLGAANPIRGGKSVAAAAPAKTAAVAPAPTALSGEKA